MGEKLCSCCLRKVPLDGNAYLNEREKYGPGICELCKTFSPLLRLTIHNIKMSITPNWLNEYKADIIKALFAEIGEGE